MAPALLSMESVQQNPLALHQETCRECSAHSWVPATVTKGYRLQFAINTISFQWGYSICSKRGFGSGAGTRNILPLREKNYKASSSVGNSEGLLLPLFSNSKEKWRLAPDNRPVCSKQALKEVQIQDAHSQGSHLFNLPRQLVCRGDLKDAYFHVSLYPSYSKYLRFSFQNEV